MRITLSVIKADIGGWVGHSRVHPALRETAMHELEKAQKTGVILDFHVTGCGDDLQLIMTHQRGNDSKEIHRFAWNVFLKGTEVAKKLKLYGAGQDLLKSSFSGNLKGMGPGFAEMTFQERESEPVVVFMADKTEPGAWSIPIYRMFADPFYNPGLVIDPSMHEGFRFEVHDVYEKKRIWLACPEEVYDLLALIGTIGRYAIKTVTTRKREVAAVTSTERLNLIAGKYVGKDDPVMAVRCQHGLPDVGEVLEPFAWPHYVGGWNRGSHNGPLMPVPEEMSHTSRFDGPPRVTSLGFQIANGMLGKPADLFDDPAFDEARRQANEMAYYMRRNGPFQPHLLDPAEMEYTRLPFVLKRLERRFKKI